MNSARFFQKLSVVLPLLVVCCTVAKGQPQTDYPTNDPSLNEYENLAATLLAEDIRHTYGGQDWTDSLSFSFDFVVYNKQRQEVARYHNKWNRATDEGLLSGKLNDGRVYTVRFSNLSACQGTMMIDSQEVAQAILPSALHTAYERLQNNLRWLLTPQRLLDSDVTLKIQSDTTIDGKEITPMKVIYNDSISTSTSEVLLYINSGYKNIERWRVNYDGVYREYIWRLTRRVGSLLFATRLWAEDFQTYIQLEKIKVTRVNGEEVAQGEEEGS